MKDILSRKDAAAYLDMSTDTLDRLRAAGTIPASQVSPRLIKYRRNDIGVDDWIDIAEAAIAKAERGS